MSVPANAPRHRVTIPSGLTIEVPTVTLSVQVADASVENLEVGVFDVAALAEVARGRPSPAHPPSFTLSRKAARRSYQAAWSASVKWALAGLGFGTTKSRVAPMTSG